MPRQAIKSVTRTMTPKVKPTDLGMEKSPRLKGESYSKGHVTSCNSRASGPGVNKAAMAIINPVKDEAFAEFGRIRI